MPTLRHSLGAESGSLTTTLVNITPAGTDRYGIVKVASFENRTVTSVTWGGVDITANVIKDAAHDGSSRKRLAWFYYLNPPASAANVVATIGGGGTPFDVYVIAEAYDGVDQATPYDNLTFTADDEGQTAVPANLTVTSATGELVVDCYYQWVATTQPSTVTVGAGQTSIQELEGVSANGGLMASSYEAGDASVAMGWSNAAGANWVMYAISLNAAGGGDANARLIGGDLLQSVSFGRLIQ